MAELVFMDGFEQYGDRDEFTSNGLWTTGTTFWPVAGRWGGKALCNNGAGTSSYARHNITKTPPYSSLLLGFALRFHPGGTYSEDICGFGTTANGRGITLAARQSGRLILRSHGNTELAYTQTPKLVMEDQWYFFEWYVLFHPTAGKSIVRVDGQEWLNLATGDTATSGNQQYAQYFIIPAQIFGECYLDDLYLYGNVDPLTDFKGPQRVITLYPTADTSDRDFAPIVGPSNYAELDDVLVSPSEQDYDATSVVAYLVGSKDLYDFSDLPDDLGAILGIQVIARGRKDDDYPRNLQLAISSNLVEGLGVDTAMSRTYLYQKHVFELDPATGAAWTPEAVNLLRAGFQVTL